MEKSAKIFVTGHRGMVGSALVRSLQDQGYKNLCMATRAELNLTDNQSVRAYFERQKPDYVFLSAARVGGIMANKTYPAEFLEQNLLIQLNVMRASLDFGVRKLCFLGSSCIYPRLSPQPMKEDYLLDGKLEPTNEGYALAKISGLKLLEFYKTQYQFNSITPLPCNLYGTNDHFDLSTAHVLSSLVRKLCDASTAGLPEVTVWGTGTAKREFMHVNDAADLSIELMNSYNDVAPINIGPGNDVSIKELAEMICSATGFKGKLIFDTTKPDGMPRKCLDVSRMKNMGLAPKISLEQGIKKTIEEYLVLKREGKIS